VGEVFYSARTILAGNRSVAAPPIRSVAFSNQGAKSQIREQIDAPVPDGKALLVQ
jgi:hypothetical protein